MYTYEALKLHIGAAQHLGFGDSFELTRGCAALLGETESEDAGRDLVIRALEALPKLSEATYPIWNDLVECAGLQPYVQAKRLSPSAAIRHEYHQSDALPGYYFHREQLALSALLRDGQSLVLSAPTSFGKSLLIEDVVASRVYGNIVIVQPTLALLDETRKKLEKYSDHYNLVVSTRQASADRNLFLFTAERVVEYDKLPEIDFFVIDEFYKLSLARDDERAIALNHAFYLLLKQTNRFYLLGPNIRQVSASLLDEKQPVWYRTNFATVAVDVEQVYRGKGWKKKDERRVNELYRLLEKLQEPTLIYCASPDKATGLADGLVRYLVDRQHKASHAAKNKDVIEWIQENIHERWSLAQALRHGVAFHHGHVPRHLGSAVVDNFNSGAIRYLFCTSTLIEGVNTTARNVALFDNHKGRKPIDFFDYKNIVGRSGRMTVHFVGRVFQFHREPAQIELDVDVPLFSQADAPLELLIQLDSKDLDDAGAKRLAPLDRVPAELHAVIRENSGIPVQGQVQFADELDRSRTHFHPLLSWASIPTYPQLEALLELCWRFFLKPGESKAGIRSHRQLAVMTLQYCHGKSLKALVAVNFGSRYWRQQEPNESARVERVVALCLGVMRQWFEYKLPKWLAAASELQAYAFRSAGMHPGNYCYLAAILENSFFKGSLSVLLDYDVPPSAIRKLEGLFGDEEDWASIERRLPGLDLSAYGLIPYEIAKLTRATAPSRRKARS